MTNLSNVYTTVVTINPDGPFPGFGCGNPYINFQQPLPPLGSWTEPGKAFSAGFDGLGNIFGMNASNFGINAENDCVSLRVIINCGGNTYDQTISAEPNLDTNCRYHLAKFGVDAEGNPETCNLEPINLSCKCRNNPNDCKIYCQGIGIGGGGS
ncbi:MAG: hypothetical protein IPN76_27910 [Saprospiraceae bacterium]|nr:hypothetical protein [Saprospiraceae bacterium]